MKKMCMLILLLLCFCQAANADCDTEAIQVETYEISSKFTPEPLKFAVYFPPCMDKRVIGGYPTLYLLHGQGMGIEIWNEIGLADIMRQAINEDGLPLFMVVVPQEERNLESFYTSGFGKAIMEEVIPFVESHYPAGKSRLDRKIGGISRGALWAEYLAFLYPDRFSSLGLHSMPGTIYDDQTLYQLFKGQKTDEHLRIGMDSGTEDDYRHDAEEAAEQLNFIGCEFERRIVSGGHNSEYWHSQMRAYLDWYFNPSP